MPKFSDLSKARLLECEEPLQVICNKVIMYYDISVICGYRDQAAQDRAYFDNFSGKMYPNSRHNSLPSQAVDLAPWPIDYDDLKQFCVMAGFVLCIAAQEKIKLRWGGAWNDYGHFELIEYKEDNAKPII